MHQICTTPTTRGGLADLPAFYSLLVRPHPQPGRCEICGRQVDAQGIDIRRRYFRRLEAWYLCGPRAGWIHGHQFVAFNRRYILHRVRCAEHRLSPDNYALGAIQSSSPETIPDKRASETRNTRLTRKRAVVAKLGPRRAR